MLQYSKSKASKKNLVSPTDADMQKVIRAFHHFGGSWEKLFKGGIEDMVLLKQIVKVGVKKKLFSLAPSWERV
jgi:hypothetical protein